MPKKSTKPNTATRIRPKTLEEIQRAIPHQLTKGLKHLREDSEVVVTVRDAGLLKTKEGTLVQVMVVVAPFSIDLLHSDPATSGLKCCEGGEIVLALNNND